MDTSALCKHLLSTYPHARPSRGASGGRKAGGKEKGRREPRAIFQEPTAGKREALMATQVQSPRQRDGREQSTPEEEPARPAGSGMASRDDDAEALSGRTVAGEKQ